MGIWGVALYSNDYTADIKDAIEAQMLHGKKPEEIFAQLYEELKPEVDEEEGYLFWLAVADQQTRYGCQENDVIARALAILETDVDNRAWLGATPKEQVARKQEMAQLRERILHPPITPKKPHITKPLKSPWAIGTLLSTRLVNSGYPLKGASYETYWDQYALLLVTDIHKVSHIYLDDEFDEFPVVCVHYEIGGGAQLPPITPQAFMPLDFWPTMSGNKSAYFLACNKITPMQKNYLKSRRWGFLMKFQRQSKNCHRIKQVIFQHYGMNLFL